MRAFRLHLFLLLMLWLLAFPSVVWSQSYTTVSATTIQDGFGALMASGVACFYPTASSGAFTIVTPSGGSAVPGPFCAVVTNGAFSLSTTPNLATAAPSGLLYTLIITKSTGVVTLTLNGLAVTGSTYNLDALVVPTPAYPAQPSAFGLGIPYYPCLFGALYTRTDASTPATSGWVCTVGGSGTFWLQSGPGVPPPLAPQYVTAPQVTLMIRSQGGGVSGVSYIVPGTNVNCSPLVGGQCTGAVTLSATGGGSGPTLHTNSTLNTSQSDLTFTDANGFAWTNPSLGVEKVGVDGTHYLPLTTDQAAWNAKQSALTLTTIGTSGPATLSGGTLNIPQYAGGSGPNNFPGTTHQFVVSYNSSTLNFASAQPSYSDISGTIPACPTCVTIIATGTTGTVPVGTSGDQNQFPSNFIFQVDSNTDSMYTTDGRPILLPSCIYMGSYTLPCNGGTFLQMSANALNAGAGIFVRDFYAEPAWNAGENGYGVANDVSNEHSIYMQDNASTMPSANGVQEPDSAVIYTEFDNQNLHVAGKIVDLRGGSQTSTLAGLCVGCGSINNVTLPTLGAGGDGVLAITSSSVTRATSAQILTACTGCAPLASPTFTGVVTGPTFVATLPSGSVNRGAYSVGTLSFSDTGVLSSFQCNLNSYCQTVMQNTNAGATASIDLIIGNDQQTSSIHFLDMGMNSSGFTGTGSLQLAGAGYIYTMTGDMVMGTNSANGVHIIYNNGATDSLLINANGPSFPTVTTTTSTTQAFCPSGTLGSVGLCTISAGITNPMTTLGDETYGGASGAFTRLAGPTTTAHVFALADIPVGGAAVAETFYDMTANMPFLATANGFSLGQTITETTNAYGNGWCAANSTLTRAVSIFVDASANSNLASETICGTAGTAHPLVITASSTNIIGSVSITGAETATGTITSNLGTAAITSATGGTGVTSVTCATATCTVSRGTYTVVGGTATTGTIITLLWPTTTTAWVCSVDMNGGTGFLGIGHSVATATGMNVTAGITVVGTTFTVDYNCVP